MRVVVILVVALLSLLLPVWASAQEGACRDRLPTDPTTIELRAADLPTTLRVLAERYRVSLIVTPDVTGTVTVSLYDVPIRDAFDALLETGGLACVARDGILVVTQRDRIRKEAEAAREQARKLEDERAKVAQAQLAAEADARRRQTEARREEIALAEAQARGPLREETIRLAYADAEDVARTLQGILGIPPTGVQAAPVPSIYAPQPPVDIPPEGRAIPPVVPQQALPFSGAQVPETFTRGITISAHRPTNSIFIRHYSTDIERIKRLVQEQLDVALPQVQIVAQMVVLQRNALEQIGVQWGGAIVDTQRRGPTFLTRGFAPGVPQETGLPSPGVAQNPGFTRGIILPVDPGTGLSTGGNLVNLPITALNPALGVLFGIVGRHFNFNLALQALEAQGKARFLAEPKTVTVENSRAVISRGFEVPFVSASALGTTQVQFKEALLKLEVIPRVIREGDVTRIRMRVLIENNEPDFTRQVQGNPPIFRRRAENDVVVREGERLVIGGVINDTDQRNINQVPVLGNIPIFGWLFKNREVNNVSEELVVVVTPSVLPVTTTR